MNDIWVLVLVSPFVTCLLLELGVRIFDDIGTTRPR